MGNNWGDRGKVIMQHYINTGCTIAELSQHFGITMGKARGYIIKALKIVGEQMALEAKLYQIEMAEEENELAEF